jgi:4-diphosphocytidyl-2-C-methyl-D-erythritol kinase
VTVLELRAYAKVNLSLLLGDTRADGRHELVTVLEPVTLEDDLRVQAPSPTGRDEVICPGVDGPNLVARAIELMRAAGWTAPPVRVEMEKRIPVAAGMGGGSSDAAALLRAADEIAPIDQGLVRELAAQLGADVPSQLQPGPSLGVGAGDVVSAVPDLAEHAVLVIPNRFGLSTADVYREADRLGLGRGEAELAAQQAELGSLLAWAGARLPARLVVNDLQPAALSLRPDIDRALDAARETGADDALVCGSGPTVVGVFWDGDALPRAAAGAERLRDRFDGAVAAGPVRAGVSARSANPSGTIRQTGS